jgi:hypothetical protein
VSPKAIGGGSKMLDEEKCQSTFPINWLTKLRRVFIIKQIGDHIVQDFVVLFGDYMVSWMK